MSSYPCVLPCLCCCYYDRELVLSMFRMMEGNDCQGHYKILHLVNSPTLNLELCAFAPCTHYGNYLHIRHSMANSCRRYQNRLFLYYSCYIVIHPPLLIDKVASLSASNKSTILSFTLLFKFREMYQQC